MSNHRESGGEPSILRRRASRPRTGGWLWLLVLLLLLLALWLTSVPDANRDRPANQEGPGFWTPFLVFFLLPLILLAGIFFMVGASFAAKKKPIHVHWFLAAIVVAGVLVGLVMWWAGQELSGILFLVLAGLLAFQLQVFSPFWYHIRNGGFLINLERFAEADRHLQKAWRRAERYSAGDFRRGAILLLLGDWHRVQSLLDKAEDHYQLALPILQEHEQKHFPELLAAYNNLGVVYYERGKYVEAEIYFRQAHSLASDQHKGKGLLLGLTEQNVAGALMELDNHCEAESLLWSAAKKTRKNVDVWLLTQGKLAKLYLRANNLGRPKSALVKHCLSCRNRCVFPRRFYCPS